MMNLLDACNKRGYLKIDFFQMGRNSFKLNKGSFFHKQVAKQKNILHAHEYICEDIGPNFFDKNFHYRIKKLNAKKCVIGAKSRIEVAKALGVDQLGSDLDHATRSGVISTFSQYLGFSPSKVFTSFSGSDQQEVDFNIHFPIS